MNSVNITGRLTKDPELRRTSNGTSVLSFIIASGRRFKTQGQPDADFIPCIAWGKTAELITKYFKKGYQIGINGRIQTGSFDNKEGKRIFTFDVVVEHIDFLEPRKKEEQGKQEYYGQGQMNGYMNGNPYIEQMQKQQDEPMLSISYDDLPF